MTQPQSEPRKQGRPPATGRHEIVKVTVRGDQLARIEQAAGDLPLGQYLLQCEAELTTLRKLVMSGSHV